MREWGTLVDWKDDKGFGFIRPDSGAKDVFLHVSALRGIARRPQTGDRLAFVVGAGKDGRPRAEQVRLPSAERHDWLPYAPLAFTFGAACYAMMRTGFPFPVLYLVMGALTYAVYNHDKEQAQHGGSRVPEATLHLMELLGGWCGAYIAQQRLRHKTVKESYQLAFWFIAVLHTGVWAVYLWNLWHGATNLPK